MLPKIENRSYSYQGEDVCNISATLVIYREEGGPVVASTGLSASYNITQPDFIEEITRQLNDQVYAYLGKLNDLNTQRLAIFPTSVDFEDATNQIFDPIQAAIGG